MPSSLNAVISTNERIWTLTGHVFSSSVMTRSTSWKPPTWKSLFFKQEKKAKIIRTSSFLISHNYKPKSPAVGSSKIIYWLDHLLGHRPRAHIFNVIENNPCISQDLVIEFQKIGGLFLHNRIEDLRGCWPMYDVQARELLVKAKLFYEAEFFVIIFTYLKSKIAME